MHSWGAQSPTARSAGLDFDPIAPVPEKVDAITVPYGYRWTPILRWGDPLFADSPDFAPGSPNAAAQALQFGYNNDFLAIMDIDRSGRSALLCCNYEFTNRAIMFPPSASEIQEQEALRTTMAAWPRRKPRHCAAALTCSAECMRLSKRMYVAFGQVGVCAGA
jgi:uncharacterized protein